MPTDGDDRSEFALIDRMVERLGDAAAAEIAVPSGDDAAVWVAEQGAAVVSVDAQVEGTHWRADTMSMGDVGWRAIVAGVSDLAAMGAEPRYALVASVLPASIATAGVDALIDGMAAACRCHALRIAGGDIVRGSEVMLAVTVFGTAQLTGSVPRVLRRDAARAGDAVAVSGTPGASAAGLALIEAGRSGEAAAAPLLDAHRRPLARLALGRAAVEAGIECAIDVSDGLLQDLGHIARRSHVGIEVELAALPLHRAAVGLLGEPRARDLALGGGEDFELALVGSERALKALASPALPLTLIGRVVDAHRGEAWAVAADGERYRPPSAGWDQLRSSPSS